MHARMEPLLDLVCRRSGSALTPGLVFQDLLKHRWVTITVNVCEGCHQQVSRVGVLVCHFNRCCNRGLVQLSN